MSIERSIGVISFASAGYSGFQALESLLCIAQHKMLALQTPGLALEETIKHFQLEGAVYATVAGASLGLGYLLTKK